jgi:hypothetical protein
VIINFANILLAKEEKAKLENKAENTSIPFSLPYIAPQWEGSKAR